MRFTRAQLSKKQTEAANRKANPHQREPGTNPRKKRPLRCKVNSRVLFYGFIHSGIVTTRNHRVSPTTSSQAQLSVLKRGNRIMQLMEDPRLSNRLR